MWDAARSLFFGFMHALALFAIVKGLIFVDVFNIYAGY